MVFYEKFRWLFLGKMKKRLLSPSAAVAKKARHALTNDQNLFFLYALIFDNYQEFGFHLALALETGAPGLFA